MNQVASPYLLAGHGSELERLQIQSRVWEPAGRELLSRLPRRPRCRALDIGCGAMGWLRVLSEWVGAGGSVVGADIDDKMLAGARLFADAHRLSNVTLVKDNLFATQLPAASFDLVHSRFQITPLGRAQEQLAVYRRLVKPGGWIVIEDPEAGSWRVNGGGPGVERLIALIVDGFHAAGGNFNAGRELPELLRGLGVEPTITSQVVALPPGHPYLRLPLQFANAMRPRLEAMIGKSELGDLLRQAEDEIGRAGAWGTTFTLIQAVASLPS